MVDFSKMEITRSGEKVTVTAKEFKTLEFLTKDAERTISRADLLREVWGYQNYPPCTTTSSGYDKDWRATLPTRRTFSQYLVSDISSCLRQKASSFRW